MTEKKTDLDRLHGVIEGRFGGRGAGKTYAMCEQVAGFIEVGEIELLCVVPRMGWVPWLRHMLEDVLEKHGLSVEHPTYDTLRCGKATVRFMPPQPRNFLGRSGLVLDFNDMEYTEDWGNFRDVMVRNTVLPGKFLNCNPAEYTKRTFRAALNCFWSKRRDR
jgi:hypothetical protein